MAKDTILKVKKLHPDAIIPTKKHDLDAGIDLYTYFNTTIPPFMSVGVPTGIAVSIPKGCYGSIREKGSGFQDFPIIVGAGVVDEGYTGELVVLLKNPLNRSYFVYAGTAIAQLIIQPYVEVFDVELVEGLPEKNSDRRNSGGVHEPKEE